MWLGWFRSPAERDLGISGSLCWSQWCVDWGGPGPPQSVLWLPSPTIQSHLRDLVPRAPELWRALWNPWDCFLVLSPGVLDLASSDFHCLIWFPLRFFFSFHSPLSSSHHPSSPSPSWCYWFCHIHFHSLCLLGLRLKNKNQIRILEAFWERVRK